MELKFHQTLLILINGVVFALLAVLSTMTNSIIHSFAIVLGFYFVWSTAYLLRYFQLKNLGFRRLSTLHEDDFLENFEEGHIYYERIMYHRGIYIQGIAVTFELVNDTIHISYQHAFQTNQMNHEDREKIKQQVERALHKNKKLRLKLLFDKIDIEIEHY